MFRENIMFSTSDRATNVMFQLNRRTVSKLNVAQLQLIQNDYLAQIKGLNEELVSLLVKKVRSSSSNIVVSKRIKTHSAVFQDDLTMEQDALMTDIEDLSDFINLKHWRTSTDGLVTWSELVICNNNNHYLTTVTVVFMNIKSLSEFHSSLFYSE